MEKNTAEQIEETIEKLVSQVKAWKADSQKALHGSQAVLNLAHARQLLKEK